MRSYWTLPVGSVAGGLTRVLNPDDVMGLAWKPVCRGEVPPPDDAPPRMIVLMENRERLARALDQVLPEAISLAVECPE